MPEKLNASQVKAGDLMAFIYWAKVKKINPTMRVGGISIDAINVDDEQEFSVHGSSLIERSASADQFSKEVFVTKTELAEKLVSSHNVPLTVCFTKAKDGVDRVLRGRLIKPEPLLGRSMVEDLDLPSQGNGPRGRLRLVDHRTLKWMIVNGIRFNIKH